MAEMSEQPPAEAKTEEDTRPLLERLCDKANWRVRKTAKEELAEKFDAADSGDDPIFAEYGGFA